MLADKGCGDRRSAEGRGDPIRQALRDRGAALEIPARRHGNVRHSVSRPLCAVRSRIEGFINRPKNSRRGATRYDRTADSFPGFAALASIGLWISRAHAARTEIALSGRPSESGGTDGRAAPARPSFRVPVWGLPLPRAGARERAQARLLRQPVEPGRARGRQHHPRLALALQKDVEQAGRAAIEPSLRLALVAHEIRIADHRAQFAAGEPGEIARRAWRTPTACPRARGWYRARGHLVHRHTAAHRLQTGLSGRQVPERAVQCRLLVLRLRARAADQGSAPRQHSDHREGGGGHARRQRPPGRQAG